MMQPVVSTAVSVATTVCSCLAGGLVRARVLTRLTRPAFWMASGNTRFWIPTSVTSAEPVMSRCCSVVQFCPGRSV